MHNWSPIAASTRGFRTTPRWREGPWQPFPAVSVQRAPQPLGGAGAPGGAPSEGPEHLFGRADGETGSRLDGEPGDDAVVDDGGEALERAPRPNPLPSMVRPIASASSPLPSDSMTTVLPTFWSSPQAPMTKGSFTETHTTRSAPLARSSVARSTNPGRWWSEQVGVKAPGTPKSTTLPWPNTSAEVVASGPLSPNVHTFTSGTLSPTAIVIRCLLRWSWFSSPSRSRSRSGCHTPGRHPQSVTEL